MNFKLFLVGSALAMVSAMETESSPVRINIGGEPIVAWKHGLYIDHTGEAGTTTICPATENCEKYNSPFTWFKIYNETHDANSVWSGNLVLDVQVSQLLYADPATGAWKYIDTDSSSLSAESYPAIPASFADEEATVLLSGEGVGKYPGSWWICETEKAGRYEVGIKNRSDAKCSDASISYSYQNAGQNTGAYKYA